MILGVFDKLWTKIKDFFGVHSPSTKFKELGIYLIQGLVNGIESLIQSIISLFNNTWTKIKDTTSKTVTNIKEKVVSIFQNIKDKLSNIMNSIKNTMSNIWSGIWTTTKGVINSIIGGIEKMCNSTIKGLNKILTPLTKVGNTILEAVGIKSFSFKTISEVKLPRLASGTVIPPRHEFATILGDQKHGTNIEAPLETIKQANREVLSELLNKYQLDKEEREIVIQALTIVNQIGDEELSNIIYKGIRLKEKELGKPLLVQ